MSEVAERDPGLKAGTTHDVDWGEVARLVLTSRALDELEETRLVPEKKVLYQFSARGHDMAQVLLGLHLRDGDAACGYYRSRPMLLALGVDLADALGSGMGREGGYSDGRDIGVVFNYPNPGGAHALPMCGGVGAQYAPAAGWAQAVTYRQRVLGEPAKGAIGVVLGGDASCATGGFWAALNIATTQSLPMLFYIEDNGYGISVPSDYQTPGRDIAANLASFRNLKIINGDGTDPAEAAALIGGAVGHARGGDGPALIRLTVPRLEGHSFQDTQTYKSADEIAAFARKISWYSMTGFSYSAKGILTNAPMGEFLRKSLPYERFEDLRVPFAAVACDLETGEEVIFKDKGDLITAIRASCTIPGVFAPVEHEGRKLIDGGVTSLVPTKAVRKLGAEIVIAVDVNACGASYWGTPSTFLGVFFQSAMLLLRTAGKSQHYRADVVIIPEISHLRPDEIGKMNEFIEAGEKAAREKIEDIKNLLKSA